MISAYIDAKIQFLRKTPSFWIVIFHGNNSDLKTEFPIFLSVKVAEDFSATFTSTISKMDRSLFLGDDSHLGESILIGRTNQANRKTIATASSFICVKIPVAKAQTVCAVTTGIRGRPIEAVGVHIIVDI